MFLSGLELFGFKSFPKRTKLTFEPGTALIHHGSVPHASEPITEGERYNFVLWLYGQHGQIPHGSTPTPQISAKDRWSVPTEEFDNFAPF